MDARAARPELAGLDTFVIKGGLDLAELEVQILKSRSPPQIDYVNSL